MTLYVLEAIIYYRNKTLTHLTDTFIHAIKINEQKIDKREKKNIWKSLDEISIGIEKWLQ